ncbi:metallopeptidase family protein [Kocuria palustris]|uniref:metallopeptidase family protein n=1 Tax=Kocuria palustris TaxID=71999 RepID=UPI0011A70DDD|nr:metallopeptidase family protein [Kocuria palustris]
MHVSDAEFESLVDDALDGIPEEIFATLDNVVVLIEAEPPAGMPELLGLYEGVPITQRDASWMGSLPDHIRIFRGPLLRLCEDREQLVREVAVTVVHEIAHHFGIEDQRLHRLGWG